jgi:hypothetical protein
LANLLAVTRTSLASALEEAPEVEPFLLDEERVRDQLSAAEELHYLGHAEPAMIAGGAALAGMLRLRAGVHVSHSASCGALLEALLAAGELSVSDHELLYRLCRAHDRLSRGYAPDRGAALDPGETGSALATMVNMLEWLHITEESTGE